MAIWQFEYMIIPKGRDKKNYKNNDQYISWIGVNTLDNALIFLSNLLPFEKSWSYDIKQYGKGDSTCIEIFLAGDDIEEIRCRLDLRNISKQLLVNILKFINMINGQIYYNDSVYEANMKNIVDLIKNSDAARFCNNPIEYLKSLEVGS